MKRYLHLTDYTNDLRKRGKYIFFKEEATQALNVSENAIRNSLSRLSRKKKIAHLKKGLYQIIPEEYSSMGSLPPEWFLPDLMAYLNIPYYIGLLTAASFHGSAHQAPQVFQVVCQQRLPEMIIGILKIKFYYSKDIFMIPVQDIKTPAGYVNLSTPEGTAFDLLRYLHQSGNLNHVATVLSELADVMDPDKLANLAQNLPVRNAQRLGYLLDYLGYDSLAVPLYYIVSKKPIRYIPLRPDMSTQNSQKNTKWHIFVNERIEADL